MDIHTLLILFVNNLGVTVPVLTAIITAFGSVIVMAKDFRLGLILFFFSNVIEFIWFYYNGYDIMIHSILILISFLLIALSYFITYKKIHEVI